MYSLSGTRFQSQLSLAFVGGLLAAGNVFGLGYIPEVPGCEDSLTSLPGQQLHAVGNHLMFPSPFVGGKFIITGNAEGSAFELIDRTSGASFAIVRQAPVPDVRLIGTAMSRDGRYIGVIYNDGFFQVLEPNDVRQKVKIVKSKYLTRSGSAEKLNTAQIQFSADGETVVAGGGAGSHALFIGSTHGPMKRLDVNVFFGFSGDGRHIFYQPNDMRAEFIAENLITGDRRSFSPNLLFRYGDGMVVYDPGTREPAPSALWRWSTSSDDGRFVAFVLNSSVIILDTRTWKFLSHPVGAVDNWSNFYFSANSKFLVVPSKDEITFLNTNSWQVSKRIKSTDIKIKYGVYDLGTSHESRFLITEQMVQTGFSITGVVSILEGDALQVRNSSMVRLGPVGELSADKSRLVSVMEIDKKSKIVSIDTSNLRLTEYEPTAPFDAKALHLSPDGHQLAYAVGTSRELTDGAIISGSRTQLLTLDRPTAVGP